jgi:release factor glutamine methyltransferase
MSTLDRVIPAAAQRLDAAGVATPRVDAELLAAHVLGVERGEVARRVMLGREAPEGFAGAFETLVAAREQRIPLQHLTGAAAFRGLVLAVGPGVFVPRPETEVVAGAAIEAARAVAARGGEPLVVDLCTGSGAIALAVATEVPDARVVALELDPAAVDWARRNVEALAPGRVDLRVADVARCDETVLSDLAGDVDVVVSNPPYIPPDATPQDVEVADFDPVFALYGGGDDGLGTVRSALAAAAGLLRPGGLLVMEHADSQGPATRALALSMPGPAGGSCWSDVRTMPDLTGRDRALLAVAEARGTRATKPAAGMTHSGA